MDFNNLITRLDQLENNLIHLKENGLDEVFLRFVKNQEVCRAKWMATTIELSDLQEALTKLKTEKSQSDIRLRLIKFELDEETKKRQASESRRDELHQQMSDLKQLLDNEPSPIPSAPPISHRKRNNRMLESSHANVSNFTNPSFSPAVISASFELSVKPVALAELSGFCGDPDNSRDSTLMVDTNYDTLNKNDLKQIEHDHSKAHPPFRCTRQRTRCSFIQPEDRSSLMPTSHQFVSRTFFRPESCKACDKKISFGRVALRCQQCSACIHVECQSEFQEGCVLAMREMSSPRENLADFCPPSPPYIPPIIYYCVKEIERRGVETEGLYRACSSEQKIKAVRNAFMRKRLGYPDLSKVQDVHTICCAVKEFLHSLPEPLITYVHWHKFAAAKPDDLACVPRSVRRLPPENQHTLAFLMLHFLRVSEMPACRMDTNNLSKILGPVIVGNSSSEPSKYRMMIELSIQKRAMEALFRVDKMFWRQILLDSRQITRHKRMSASKKKTTPRNSISNNKKRRNRSGKYNFRK